MYNVRDSIQVTINVHQRVVARFIRTICLIETLDRPIRSSTRLLAEENRCVIERRFQSNFGPNKNFESSRGNLKICRENQRFLPFSRWAIGSETKEFVTRKTSAKLKKKRIFTHRNWPIKRLKASAEWDATVTVLNWLKDNQTMKKSSVRFRFVCLSLRISSFSFVT